MSYATRNACEKMTAPVVAWLIDHNYVAQDAGILDLTRIGRTYIRNGYAIALRMTVPGTREVRLPEKKSLQRERL